MTPLIFRSCRRFSAFYRSAAAVSRLESGRVASPRRSGFESVWISIKMLQRAHSRDLSAVRGIAEALPVVDGAFDYCLIVTTICFVDDATAMMEEARRILRHHGNLIIGFIDRESSLGRKYLARRSENVFYRDATFYSARDVESLLVDAGFGELTWVQTLFEASSEKGAIDTTRPGYGEGSFVVVRATSLRSRSDPSFGT